MYWCHQEKLDINHSCDKASKQRLGLGGLLSGLDFLRSFQSGLLWKTCGLLCRVAAGNRPWPRQSRGLRFVKKIIQLTRSFLRRDEIFFCLRPNIGAARKHSRKNHCWWKRFNIQNMQQHEYQKVATLRGRTCKQDGLSNLYSNSTLVVSVHVKTTRVKAEKISYRIEQVSAYIKRYSVVHSR